MKMFLPMLFLVVACGKGAPPTAPSASTSSASASSASAPSAPEPTAPTPSTPEPGVEPAPATAPKHYEIAWSYEPEDRSLYARTLVSRADGSVVVLGGSNSPGNTGLRLTALDKDGKVLWDKTHPEKLLEVSGVKNGGGFALPDGGFAVVGQRMDAELMRQAWFGMFDASGTLVWQVWLNTPEAYALGHWTIPLADGRALVSIERGDGSKPTQELHVVSFAERTVVSTSTLDGQPAVPERAGDAYTTVVWKHGAEGGPKGAPHRIDMKTGALTPAAAPSETWKEAAGDSVLVDSMPLGDKRLVVVRGHGASATVTLVLTDDSGARIWRHFIMEEGFDQVTVVQPMVDGFAFAQERWKTDPRGLRDPDGYRVVRMR